MNRQRSGESSGTQGYHTKLLKAIAEFLPRQGLPLQSSDARLRWTDRLLAICALLMVWQPASTAKDAFTAARDVVVGMYPSRRRPGRSYEGFMRTLQLSSAMLVSKISAALRHSVKRLAGPLWRQDGWVILAVDGSRIDCPRTVANEEAFGCAGRSKSGPQQMLTTLFHVGTGLVWSWRRGRGDAAERTHLRQMLEELPDRTLLLADAGFTGYELLSQLRECGHDFIVRVGSNVSLLQKLGYAVREHEGIVYLWPTNRRQEAPLVLRLVTIKARHPVHLLCSVLERERLGDASVAELYRRRWRVEVLFRSLKQTLERRKLRSVSPGHAAVELDWSVLALWLLGLTVGRAAGRKKMHRCSVASALRVIRRAMAGPYSRGLRLRASLSKALRDEYVRRGSKQARDWPHKKNEPPPREPKIRTATKAEVLAARRLWEQLTAA